MNSLPLIPFSYVIMFFCNASLAFFIVTFDGQMVLYPGSASGTESACQETQETWVWSLGWEDPLGEEMATHSSILAWKTPWAEECGAAKSQTQLSD